MGAFKSIATDRAEDARLLRLRADAFEQAALLAQASRDDGAAAEFFLQADRLRADADTIERGTN